jgi:hypothetical protein
VIRPGRRDEYDDAYAQWEWSVTIYQIRLLAGIVGVSVVGFLAIVLCSVRDERAVSGGIFLGVLLATCGAEFVRALKGPPKRPPDGRS